MLAHYFTESIAAICEYSCPEARQESAELNMCLCHNSKKKSQTSEEFAMVARIEELDVLPLD